MTSKRPEMPRIFGLDGKSFVEGQAGYHLEYKGPHTMTGNLLVSLPNSDRVVTQIGGSPNEYYFSIDLDLIETEPTVAPMPPVPDHWRILWDASWSRSKEDIEKAVQFISQLPENADYELVVFRNVMEPARNLKTRAELLQILSEIIFDGATNFKPLESLKPFDGQVLLFSDGFDTVNGTLGYLGPNITAVVSSSNFDDKQLIEVTDRRIVNLSKFEGEAALREVLAPYRHVSAVEGDGISMVYGIGQRTDGHISLVGRMEKPVSEAVIVFSDGTRMNVNFDTAKISEDLAISKLWASKRVELLKHRAAMNRGELLEIGRKFGIASPMTSMIILEELDQWVMYGLEPPVDSSMHDAWKLKYNKLKLFHEYHWASEVGEAMRNDDSS